MSYKLGNNPMMKTVVAFFLMLSLSQFSFAARELHEVIDASVPLNLDGSLQSLEKVKKDIIEACQRRRWNVHMVDEQTIKAGIHVRSKHYAEVLIPFTQEKYSILYSDSENLDFTERTAASALGIQGVASPKKDNRMIHRKYNGWVLKLSGTIQKYLSRMDNI